MGWLQFSSVGGLRREPRRPTSMGMRKLAKPTPVHLFACGSSAPSPPYPLQVRAFLVGAGVQPDVVPPRVEGVRRAAAAARAGGSGGGGIRGDAGGGGAAVDLFSLAGWLTAESMPGAPEFALFRDVLFAAAVGLRPPAGLRNGTAVRGPEAFRPSFDLITVRAEELSSTPNPRDLAAVIVAIAGLPVWERKRSQAVPDASGGPGAAAASDEPATETDRGGGGAARSDEEDDDARNDGVEFAIRLALSEAGEGPAGERALAGLLGSSGRDAADASASAGGSGDGGAGAMELELCMDPELDARLDVELGSRHDGGAERPPAGAAAAPPAGELLALQASDTSPPADVPALLALVRSQPLRDALRALPPHLLTGARPGEDAAEGSPLAALVTALRERGALRPAAAAPEPPGQRTEEAILGGGPGDAPDYGGALSPQEALELDTALCAPWLRIPLALAFFAARPALLLAPQLRRVLTQVLFEPLESGRFGTPPPPPQPPAVSGAAVAATADVPALALAALNTAAGPFAIIPLPASKRAEFLGSLGGSLEAALSAAPGTVAEPLLALLATLRARCEAAGGRDARSPHFVAFLWAVRTAAAAADALGVVAAAAATSADAQAAATGPLPTGPLEQPSPGETASALAAYAARLDAFCSSEAPRLLDDFAAAAVAQKEFGHAAVIYAHVAVALGGRSDAALSGGVAATAGGGAAVAPGALLGAGYARLLTAGTFCALWVRTARLQAKYELGTERARRREEAEAARSSGSPPSAGGRGATPGGRPSSPFMPGGALPLALATPGCELLSTAPWADATAAVLRTRRQALAWVAGLQRRGVAVPGSAAPIPSSAADVVLSGVLRASLPLPRLDILSWRPDAPGSGGGSSVLCREVVESPHPYAHGVDYFKRISFPGAAHITLTFDARCATETRREADAPSRALDYVEIFRDESLSTLWHKRFCGGACGADGLWPGVGSAPPLVIPADSLVLHFHSDSSINAWGFRVTATAPVAEAAIARLSAARSWAGVAALSSADAAGASEAIAAAEAATPGGPSDAMAESALAASANDVGAAAAWLLAHAPRLAAEAAASGGGGSAVAVRRAQLTHGGGDNGLLVPEVWRTAGSAFTLHLCGVLRRGRPTTMLPSGIAAHPDFAEVMLMGTGRPRGGPPAAVSAPVVEEAEADLADSQAAGGGGGSGARVADASSVQCSIIATSVARTWAQVTRGGTVYDLQVRRLQQRWECAVSLIASSSFSRRCGPPSQATARHCCRRKPQRWQPAAPMLPRCSHGWSSRGSTLLTASRAGPPPPMGHPLPPTHRHLTVKPRCELQRQRASPSPYMPVPAEFPSSGAAPTLVSWFSGGAAGRAALWGPPESFWLLRYERPRGWRSLCCWAPCPRASAAGSSRSSLSPTTCRCWGLQQLDRAR